MNTFSLFSKMFAVYGFVGCIVGSISLLGLPFNKTHTVDAWKQQERILSHSGDPGRGLGQARAGVSGEAGLSLGTPKRKICSMTFSQFWVSLAVLITPNSASSVHVALVLPVSFLLLRTPSHIGLEAHHPLLLSPF